MNKLYRVLGKRGRITIPFEIRQRVGFRYNDVLYVAQLDCTVEAYDSLGASEHTILSTLRFDEG